VDETGRAALRRYRRERVTAEREMHWHERLKLRISRLRAERDWAQRDASSLAGSIQQRDRLRALRLSDADSPDIGADVPGGGAV
jgi:hypothetical protein